MHNAGHLIERVGDGIHHRATKSSGDGHDGDDNLTSGDLLQVHGPYPTIVVAILS
jgi:hypothetical protein